MVHAEKLRAYSKIINQYNMRIYPALHGFLLNRQLPKMFVRSSKIVAESLLTTVVVQEPYPYSQNESEKLTTYNEIQFLQMRRNMY